MPGQAPRRVSAHQVSKCRWCSRYIGGQRGLFESPVYEVRARSPGPRSSCEKGCPACIGVSERSGTQPQHSSTSPAWQTQLAHRIGLQQTEQGRDDIPSLQVHRGSGNASKRTCFTASRGEDRVQDSEYHDGAWDARWRDDRMTAAVARSDSWIQRDLCNKAVSRCSCELARSSSSVARRASAAS